MKFTPAICTDKPTLDGMLTFGVPTLDEWEVYDADLKLSKVMTYAYVKIFKMGKDEAGASRTIRIGVALWVDRESYSKLMEAVTVDA